MGALPYGRHRVDEDDIAAVSEVLRSDFLTTGDAVGAFESAFAVTTGSAHAIACNNGTSALYMAARAAGVGPGDVVIVPALTFLATASAPHLAGAEVVFADVEPDTGLMGTRQLDHALGEAHSRFPNAPVRAVFVVHLNGQCADMPALRAALDEAPGGEGIAIIEDACHALGGEVSRLDESRSQGRASPVGESRWSDMSVFSFHPVKTIAMGEGGAVTCRDGEIARRLNLLRNHSMERNPEAWSGGPRAFAPDGSANAWYYEMDEPSLNFRVPDILCALALSQLDKLTEWVLKRRQLFDRYCELLPGASDAASAPAQVTWGQPAWHLCAAQIDFAACAIDRHSLMLALRARGVGTQVHYIPVHRQPYWERRYGARSLAGAEHYYDHALSLPLYVDLELADVEYVVAALGECLTDL